ncbi:MAG: sugar phosphate isomerase/epimerase [Planctomycetes bacterium]|nr:sugar phosphate isomerase/epimerase [Planctomycetota bacterium]
MIRLSGFADEIGPDIELQIQILASEGIRCLELRGVWGKNVLDFSDQQRREIKKRLTDVGIGVSAIGSPIGKVRIDEPWANHVERFKIALDAAEFFESPYIRVFSYYPPEGGRMADHRAEVIRRLNEQVQMAKGRRTKLLHENEKDIYGEKTDACLDIARNVPGMSLIFDPANFVQAGIKPVEAWQVLRDHVVYFHIKDALLDSGKVVPVGDGDGNIPEILKDAILTRRYDGFLSMEPHLAAAGQFSGFSGPDLFKQAVQSLKRILDNLGVPYA